MLASANSSDSTIDFLIKKMKGHDESLDPDRWSEFKHLEQNGFNVWVIRFYLDQIIDPTNVDDELNREIVLKLRDHARAELGMPLLSEGEKAGWPYPPLEQAFRTFRPEMTPSGRPSPYDQMVAIMPDQDGKVLAQEVGNYLVKNYPELVRYMRSVSSYNDHLFKK